MTDKNLLQKLSNLHNIQANSQWLADNRELLCKQISNSSGYKLSSWEIFFINFKCLAQTSTRPVFALGIFLFVLVTSSIFGHQMFSQAKPNDSLYIARVISEKARLNTVLDAQERDKMAVKFATNHAKDISVVLADPSFNNEANQDRVAELNENFNKEVEIARTKIERINSRALSSNNSSNDLSQAASTTDQADALVSNTSSDDELVSIATDLALITEKGIEVDNKASDTNNTKTGGEVLPANNQSSLDMPAVSEELVPTTILIESTANTSPMRSLDEAKELFDKKDYDNANSKLEEINELIK